MVFRNNDNQTTQEPRIVFTNLRRPSRELLTLGGYLVFSTLTYLFWFIPIFLIGAFEVEIKVSQDIILAIAGSSVELSALALAVLGILSEVNKKDRWFKIGLLFTSTLFVITVLGGFYSSYTWDETYAQSQKFTVIVVGIFAFGTILQVIPWVIKRRQLLPKIDTSSFWQNMIALLPFIPPFFLLLPIGGNLPGIISIIFTGGIISLIVLLGVTVITAFNTRNVEEQEDEFVTILKQRYATEIKEIVRIGEVKTIVRELLIDLQDKRQNNSRDQSLQLIDRSELFIALRSKGVKDNERVFDQALRMLVEEGSIYQKSYDSLWLVPKDHEISSCIDVLSNYPIFVTILSGDKRTEYNKGQVNGLVFKDFVKYLESKTKIPQSVIFEYIVPRIMDKLEQDYYVWSDTIDYGGTRIHVYIQENFNDYNRLGSSIRVNHVDQSTRSVKIISPFAWSEQIEAGYSHDLNELQSSIVSAIQKMESEDQ